MCLVLNHQTDKTKRREKGSCWTRNTKRGDDERRGKHAKARERGERKRDQSLITKFEIDCVRCHQDRIEEKERLLEERKNQNENQKTTEKKNCPQPMMEREKQNSEWKKKEEEKKNQREGKRKKEKKRKSQSHLVD